MVAAIGSLPLLLELALLLRPGLCGSYVPPAKYIIISNARTGTVGYAKLQDNRCGEVRTLINRDLVHPQGLAVDQKRQLLLIADSELHKVVSYGLTVHEDGSLAVDDQTPVAEGVETRWVAVDGSGNIYMTDELNGKVLKVSAKQVLEGETTAKPVFAAGGAIAAPGGIATDNFHLYWTNKEGGRELGTLVKALPGPSSGPARPANATVLAKNAPKAYGVCFALDSLYFTAPQREVFAVRPREDEGSDGEGHVVTVSSQLSSPRGCAWDGASTVFVADRTANGIFALPGPSELARVSTSSGTSAAVKVCDFEGAFGVALFSSAVHAWRGRWWTWCLLCAQTALLVFVANP